jgi:hydrogenase maturation factor
MLARLSVVPEALLAAELVRVHAMHDPTEGGVATALWELADAAGVGLAVEAERIPILAEGATLCREFGLDPLGTIASGALLMALAPADAGVVLHALAREGIDSAFIGRVVPREAGVMLMRAGQPGPLPRFDQDEITRLFA